MKGLLKDKEHLFRMAGLFAVGITIFVVARVLLVPAGFGLYGHYRAGALDDARAHAPAFAGRAACSDCHGEVVEEKTKGRHANVGCEACHGPLAKHADDPDAVKPEKPDAKSICLRCHEANTAKPKGFPQVEPKDHGDGSPCPACHKPHQPSAA